MKAMVGDRIIVQSRHLDEPQRDGEIIEVHGPDGAPPYVVRWSEDGHTALLFPGPDAQISGHTPEKVIHHRGKAWHANVVLTEEDGHTVAEASLNTGSHVLHGRGEAQRNPADQDVPEIGDELAAARALVELSKRLVETTAADISAIEGQPIHLTG
ncbi:DUF1918 domain-containing protein [Catenulispora subtropica]|uniref:DUF1918 domain-containing protein n=1 Tax=Catenulispora subtropica TaxID=450798 RepID=A0ABN2SKY9_9ACTN